MLTNSDDWEDGVQCLAFDRTIGDTACCQGLSWTGRVSPHYPRPHPELFGTAQSIAAEKYLRCVNWQQAKAPSTTPAPNLQRTPFLYPKGPSLSTPNLVPRITYSLLGNPHKTVPSRLRRIYLTTTITAYPPESSRKHINRVIIVLGLISLPSSMVCTVRPTLGLIRL